MSVDRRLRAMLLLSDLLICLRFFSRLPIPASSREAMLGDGGLAAAAAMAPAAGLALGSLSAVILLGAAGVGLPASVAATLAVTTLVVATGAMHEDGLADCADGFGGGHTPARKLEIMRDSRIGAFGGCAITLALILRVASVAEIVTRAPLEAAAVVLAAAALSRALCLLPLATLAPARVDGAGRAAAAVEPRALCWANGLGVAVLLLVGALVGRPATALLAALLAFAGVAGVVGLARRQIAGQTGDVAGAAQQVAEIAVYLVFAAG